MNAGRFSRICHAVPIALLALAEKASAHPGHHGASYETETSSALLKHFLTNLDHIGPVIAAGVVAWVLWRWAKSTNRS